MNYILRFYVLLFSLLVFGCTPNTIIREREDNTHTNHHERFTLAIYDSNNFLISDPIGDLKNHTSYHNLYSLCSDDIKDLLKRHGKESVFKTACKGAQAGEPPITDIYVISHGWNYTMEDSINLYNDYIKKLEDKFGCKNGINNKNQTCESFHPYYVFVSWPSTIRPISQTLKAVLPFSIASSSSPLGVISEGIDKVVFHIPTVWQQSLNTYKISKIPERILKAGDYKTLYDDSQETGQIKIPLSIVLYELMVSAQFST
jgi:hypothetical protein